MIPHSTTIVPGVLLISLLLFSSTINAQGDSSIQQITDSSYQTVIAGKQYEATPFHKKLFGSHYRKEWITPVKVKMVSLDTLFGGLIPVREGGRQQTQTLHLKDKRERPYVLRSIDKSYSGALPEVLRGTFIEKWANDQVSVAHPYSAVTVPILANAVGILHTYPQIVYVPKQAALGEYNESYGNKLYLLEERPDGDQSGVIHFGSSENVIGSESIFNNLASSNWQVLDQKAFVKARLFDMFIGDWARHEDQWRWASFKHGEEIIYRPIPRDRDHIYTKFDGLLVSIATSADALENLQTFDTDIKDIEEFNAQARHLDRRFTNEVVLEDWVAIAKELQQALPDSIIELAVHQMPPEVFTISGNEIITKLKGRRDRLIAFAEEYYSYLAKDVDIPGSYGREKFEVKPVDEEKIQVNLYRIDSVGSISSEPYYSRIFHPKETKEIRLYGLSGEDQYFIAQNINDDFLVRVVGGVSIDSFAFTNKTEKETVDVIIYEDKENRSLIPAGFKKDLSDNVFVHYYDYRAFAYDTKGTIKSFSHTKRDRFYLRFGYEIQRQHFRKSPFGFEHKIFANYSISQGAPSFGYEGIINQLFGKWNLLLYANYDRVVDVNFFGIGNNTTRTNDPNRYYRLRRRDFLSSIGLAQNFKHYHKLGVNGFYNYLDVLIDKEEFIGTIYTNFKPSSFERKHYGGAEAVYSYERINHPVLPTKGLGFTASVSYTQNLKDQELSFTRYRASIGTYLPLSKRLILVLKAGGATLDGKPEFFQLNELGGTRTLRGYVRERFWGKTTFYNENELQWVKDFKSFIMNGKIGFLAHYDVGRVWQPNEKSSIWHNGFGGGIILAPFNRIAISGIYSISEEDNVIHIRVGKFF